MDVWMFAAVLCAALSLVMLFFVLRQAGRVAASESNSQSLRQQLDETTRLVTGIGQELCQARAESREQAERSRSSALHMQAEHMQVLQKQVVDVATLTQAQLEDVRRSMHGQLQHLTGTVGEQLGGHAKIMMEVRGQLGALAQAALSLQDLGKDISGLQDILRAPKLRGNLGEVFLAEILRQVLPTGAFELQHRLAGAERGTAVVVDAVIRLGDRLVPIDSKFPLESFRRLLEQADLGDNPEAERLRRRKAFLDVVKKHIDCIAEKYIRPDCGTYDFALAYLPAENIYYEAIVRDEMTDLERSITVHAAKRKVIVVSPNTFYAYLLTVAYGLKGMHIEKQAEAMRGQLIGFQKKFLTFLDVFQKVGRHLDLAQRSYEDANKRGGKLDEQMGKITGEVHSLDDPGPQQVLPLVQHG